MLFPVGTSLGEYDVNLFTSLSWRSVQDQGPVLGWEGAIMSVFSREAADWEGSGYGPMLATPSVRY